MTQDRIHRAVSDDGTEIAGRAARARAPLVLVNGGLDDGDTSWGAVLPLLRGQLTCYLLSPRGRGLSGTTRTTRPHASSRTSRPSW